MEQRRKYDREFKAQAVQLCEQEDVPITEIARELGLDVKLLYRWRREAQRDGKSAFPGQGHAKGGADEIRRLQRQLARVEMAPRGSPDILKKALGVLAQPSK